MKILVFGCFRSCLYVIFKLARIVDKIRAFQLYHSRVPMEFIVHLLTHQDSVDQCLVCNYKLLIRLDELDRYFKIKKYLAVLRLGLWCSQQEAFLWCFFFNNLHSWVRRRSVLLLFKERYYLWKPFIVLEGKSFELILVFCETLAVRVS